MNVFWHELKTYRTSTIIWSVSLALLVVLFLSMYPSFTKDIDASQKILSNLPLQLREALGISLSNFFTIFGFYSYLFTFVTLAGAIQAMNVGVGIISKENSGKTADFLLTKPVARTSVITQKLLAAAAVLVITNVVFMAAALAGATIVSTQQFNVGTFMLITLSLFLVQLAFLALGFLLSAALTKIRSVISVSLPITFAFFIIGSLGAIIGNDTVRLVTPFKFYDPAYIAQHGSYELKYLAIEAVFIIVAIALTYVIFNKKDVPSAT